MSTITLRAAGELLGLSTRTVRNLIDAGRLPSHLEGHRRVVEIEDVERLLHEGNLPHPRPNARRPLVNGGDDV